MLNNVYIAYPGRRGIYNGKDEQAEIHWYGDGRDGGYDRNASRGFK